MPISGRYDSPRVSTVQSASTSRAETPKPSAPVAAPRTELFEASRFGDAPRGLGARPDSFVRGDGSIVLGQTYKSPQVLLREQGDAAMKAGHYDEARKAYEAMKALPNVSLYSVPGDFTRDESNGSAYKGGTTISATKTGDVDSHTVADDKLKQLAHVEEMSKVAGKKPIDPHNMEDMRLYFAKFSQGKSTAEVSGELKRYFDNFYTHVGPKPGTVTWDGSVTEGNRAKEATKLLAGQGTDASGRKYVNCEAFTFLTAAVLKDVTKADGKTPRFDVWFSKNAEHEVAVVFDEESKPKGKRFDVDNANVSVLPVPIAKPAEREVVAKLRLPPNEGVGHFN